MAILDASGRGPAIQAAAERFETEHLTDPDARQIAMEVARLAALMLLRIREDDPELVDGLRDLADARDSFILAKTASKR